MSGEARGGQSRQDAPAVPVMLTSDKSHSGSAAKNLVYGTQASGFGAEGYDSLPDRINSCSRHMKHGILQPSTYLRIFKYDHFCVSLTPGVLTAPMRLPG